MINFIEFLESLDAQPGYTPRQGFRVLTKDREFVMSNSPSSRRISFEPAAKAYNNSSFLYASIETAKKALQTYIKRANTNPMVTAGLQEPTNINDYIIEPSQF